MTTTSTIVELGFHPPHDPRQDIELMSIADLQTRAPPAHFRQLQRADFFRFMGVTQGSASMMVDFSTWALTPGVWLLIRPGQVVRYDFSTPWEGWQAVFRPEALFASAGNADTDEVQLLRRMEDLACLSQLDAVQHAQMCQAFASMAADSALPCAMALRNTLLRLQLVAALLRLSLWQPLSASVPGQGGQALIHFKRFRLLLQSEFARQHQVQFYAQRLGMSEKNLSRASMAGAGISAKAYIARHLLLQAKRLLAHTHWPVQSIADQLGFDEATHFVKFFRKHQAMTPTAFRQQQ